MRGLEDEGWGVYDEWDGVWALWEGYFIDGWLGLKRGLCIAENCYGNSCYIICLLTPTFGPLKDMTERPFLFIAAVNES